MARERQTASDVQQALAELDGDMLDRTRPARGALDGRVLTHAQTHALRRCAPLTSAEFKTHRQLLDQRKLSLRRALGRDGGDGARPPRPRPSV